MKTKQALQEYLLEIEIRKYTPKTIRSYRNNLNLFVRYLQEEADVFEAENITLAVVRKFSLYMVERGKRGTYINGLLKTAKSFIQYCYDEGYGGFNTKKNFKWCKEDKPIITAFKVAHVKQMLSSCNGSDFLSVRDKALLSVLFETGIRCWELCCITPGDIHEDFIIINGKNHKQRVVPITPILRKALLKYDTVKERYFTLKSTDNYYFLSNHGRQLTNCAVEHIVKRHGEGIEGIRVSPHTCRHFFAQQQVKLGTDLYTISRLLGHENIGITQTYLNSLRDDEVIQIAKQKSVLMNLALKASSLTPAQFKASAKVPVTVPTLAVSFAASVNPSIGKLSPKVA
ncbi:MAG: tyrosine-type recombinase/integrase [Phascolarctobacterium sp.]|nr:tyrosine-type recombinase/integrase [Phascolarctobacterium sp.]